MEKLLPGMAHEKELGVLQMAVEKALCHIVRPVLDGSPALGIDTVKEEAGRLLRSGGRPEAVVAMLRQQHERPAVSMDDITLALTNVWWPEIGCAALLAVLLYRQLRQAALVAELFGQDTSDHAVRERLFLCLLPGEDVSFPRLARSAVEKVSGALARKVLTSFVGRWGNALALFQLCHDAWLGEPTTSHRLQCQAIRNAEVLFRPLPITKLAVLAVGTVSPTLVVMARACLDRGLALTVLAVCVVAGAWLLLRRLTQLALTWRRALCTVAFLTLSVAPMITAFGLTKQLLDCCRRQMRGDADVLIVLLGLRSWLRLVKACLGCRGRAWAGHAQSLILGLLLLVGVLDLAGGTGLRWQERLPPFGTLRLDLYCDVTLQLLAAECQGWLFSELGDARLLLRVLSPSEMVGFAWASVACGLTGLAHALFRFQELVDLVEGTVPPPWVCAVIATLRRRSGGGALAAGALLALLLAIPPTPELAQVGKAFALGLGAAAATLTAQTFVTHREVLVDSTALRWLVLLPHEDPNQRKVVVDAWKLMTRALTEDPQEPPRAIGWLCWPRAVWVSCIRAVWGPWRRGAAFGSETWSRASM